MISNDRIGVDKIVHYSRKVKNRVTLALGVDKKVFNLSLHRSGTQSVAAFLTRIGLSSQHWPGADFDKKCLPFLASLDTAGVWDVYRPFLKMHSSFHDVPIPFLYSHIIREFPHSLYMIVVREPFQWILSVREHMKDRELTVSEKFMYWTVLRNRWNHIAQYTDDELACGYCNFISNVTNIMVKSGISFRSFNLESPDLATSIAGFCGVTHLVPRLGKIDAANSRLAQFA